MNRNTLRIAVIAIVAVVAWKHLAPKVPALARFAL